MAVLRLYDTATDMVRPLELRQPGHMSMYVCGPTVYDVPHIGHGRAVLVYDVLRRYLTWSGLEVRLVSNITDIDDKIINRANTEGRNPEEVAIEFEDAWYAAIDQLGVLRPNDDPHATAYVEGMVELIEGLIARGAAYETNRGVEFSVDKVPGYGLLTNQSLDSLQSGARVEIETEKHNPLDFALWKKAKPDEPAWPSPWGPGRPGWHTECVVMSLDLLGEGFDLHAGGLDLKFPHHENERAQAVAMGRDFARHWMHHAFVEVGGEKMSKSLHNFTSLTDLLLRADARAYRLLVLQAHYRSPLEVTPNTIEQATRSLTGLDNLARRAVDIGSDVVPDATTMEHFRAAMDDDLDTPGAMAVIFDAVRQANVAFDSDGSAASLVAALRAMTEAIGLELRADDDALDAEILGLVSQRDQARASRDWAGADRFRDELISLGYVVEDTSEGTKVRRG
ncbi:MAG: cysteine--tRNA ligase [Acidimicrobiales bacterium]